MFLLPRFHRKIRSVVVVTWPSPISISRLMISNQFADFKWRVDTEQVAASLHVAHMFLNNLLPAHQRRATLLRVTTQRVPDCISEDRTHRNTNNTEKSPLHRTPVPNYPVSVISYFIIITKSGIRVLTPQGVQNSLWMTKIPLCRERIPGAVLSWGFWVRFTWYLWAPSNCKAYSIQSQVGEWGKLSVPLRSQGCSATWLDKPDLDSSNMALSCAHEVSTASIQELSISFIPLPFSALASYFKDWHLR